MVNHQHIQLSSKLSSLIWLNGKSQSIYFPHLCFPIHQKVSHYSRISNTIAISPYATLSQAEYRNNQVNEQNHSGFLSQLSHFNLSQHPFISSRIKQFLDSSLLNNPSSHKHYWPLIILALFSSSLYEGDQQAASCETQHKSAPKSSLYSWGNGTYGQLGHGDSTNHALPARIKDLDLNVDEFITTCTAGTYNSSCLSSMGRIFTWGRTQDNLLGHNSSSFISTSSFQALPKVIEKFQDDGIKIVQVASGHNHMLALSSEGHIYSWGLNTISQCGRDNNTEHDSLWSRRTPISAMTIGRVMGEIEGKKITQIACGKNHCLALDEDDHLYMWGSNRDSQIGGDVPYTVQKPLKIDRSTIQGKIKQISCGSTNSCVLTNQGKLYTWGLDAYGELGHGKQLTRVPQPKLVRNLSSQFITQISSGDYHMGAISQKGEVFVWGYDRDGQCGSGDLTDKSLPIKVEALKDYKACQIECGGGHTAVLVEDGRLFIFGRGQEGQLGRADFVESITNRSLPVEVNYFSENKFTIKSFSCGGEHNLLLTHE